MQAELNSPTLVADTLAPANTNAVQLTARACRRLWLGAPTANTSGAHANTSEVLVGALGTDGETVVWFDHIAADGSRDAWYHVENANQLYIKLVTAGDKLQVAYQ